MLPLLVLDDVAIGFGPKLLLAHANASLGPGQMLGLAGESGCGKTSLLRAILGFVPLSAGRIEVGGTELGPRTVDEIRRRTAYLPQEMQPAAATGRELIALTHSLRANAGARQPDLQALGLDESLLDMQASKLSGGQRQRILLAAALALPKQLLLLDEPTSALDQETTQLVAATLRETLLKEQRAAVVVSHSAALLDACDFTLTFQA